MLSTTIVPKYFGHSKYQSFCRQLTSYGFHRIFDKNEETHCYAHNDTTDDVHSILKIKVDSFDMFYVCILLSDHNINKVTYVFLFCPSF